MILKQFIYLSDIRTQVAALLYGKVNKEDANLMEIHALIMIPQLATHQSIQMAEQLPSHSKLKSLTFLGYIQTLTTANNDQISDQISDRISDQISSSSMFHHFQGRNDDQPLLAILCQFTTASITLHAYHVTNKVIHKKENEDQVLPLQNIILTRQYNAFFLTARLWNYYFQAIKFYKQMEYQVTLQKPLTFYDNQHRFNHFLLHQKIQVNNHDENLLQQDNVFF